MMTSNCTNRWLSGWFKLASRAAHGLACCAAAAICGPGSELPSSMRGEDGTSGEEDGQ